MTVSVKSFLHHYLRHYPGTYPFWVWQPDEVLIESLHITIPRQSPSGDYVLLVGLYDPFTGERAPIGNAPDFGSNRLLLSRITVE